MGGEAFLLKVYISFALLEPNSIRFCLTGKESAEEFEIRVNGQPPSDISGPDLHKLVRAYINRLTIQT